MQYLTMAYELMHELMLCQYFIHCENAHFFVLEFNKYGYKCKLVCPAARSLNETERESESHYSIPGELIKLVLLVCLKCQNLL